MHERRNQNSNSAIFLFFFQVESYDLTALGFSVVTFLHGGINFFLFFFFERWATLGYHAMN